MEFIDLKSQQALIKDKIDKRIRAVLDHGKYIMGPEVYELEKRLSEYAKTKFCLTCSSGTDALLIPLLAKKIGPGDAIITTPFTYIATAEVISLLKATPIFIDIYPTTFNLDPSNIESAIDYAKQKNLKPKAIIAVDLFGLPARYRLIKKIAKDNDLFLIEDAAQSFGANISNVKSGKFGDVSSTSFFPAKPLGCYGDGGAIFTDDEDLDIERFETIGVIKNQPIFDGAKLDKFMDEIKALRKRSFVHVPKLKFKLESHPWLMRLRGEACKSNTY